MSKKIIGVTVGTNINPKLLEVTVDDKLSDTSINPVQNKIITAQLNRIDERIIEMQSFLNIDYKEVAFDTTEIVFGTTTTNTTSVLGQAVLGQLVLT